MVIVVVIGDSLPEVLLYPPRASFACLVCCFFSGIGMSGSLWCICNVNLYFVNLFVASSHLVVIFVVFTSDIVLLKSLFMSNGFGVILLLSYSFSWSNFK